MQDAAEIFFSYGSKYLQFKHKEPQAKTSTKAVLNTISKHDNLNISIKHQTIIVAHKVGLTQPEIKSISSNALNKNQKVKIEKDREEGTEGYFLCNRFVYLGISAQCVSLKFENGP